MIHLYGIPNCDTVTKSIKWLKQNNIPFSFHHFREEPLEAAKLKNWLKAVGLAVLLNKKSTTWRQLTPQEQETALTEKGAIALMRKHTSLVKRPVAEWPDGSVTAGFDEKLFAARLGLPL